jgi:WS/DGAT/MGAT family acyltransferase
VEVSESQPFFEELSPLDAFFLYAERHEAPLHIGAVYIFEGEPEVPGGRGAQGIGQTLEERLHLVPRYRQKVRFRPFNLGHPVWVDDADFDLSYHVRRAALPQPGDEATLRDYAARVFARRLDVNKPLWELYVVEGLSRGRVAMINKVHHAMVDGISSVDLGTLLFDMDPEQQVTAPPAPWRPRAQPDDRQMVLSELGKLRRLARVNPFSLPFRLPELGRRAVEEALSSPWIGAASLAWTVLRPGRQLFFNRMIGPHRRIHHFAFPLQAVKDVKNAVGGTVNDVVLTVVAEGMRRWLDDRGEELPESLRVFCPVSVRDSGQRYALGNRVSGMVVDLPLGPMPLLTRLARVSAAAGDLKRSRQAVAAQTLTAISEWAPATLHALGSRLASQPQLGSPALVNMVVTNVPGPQVPFYTGGARMLEVWPLVPTYHTVGLNLALFSYDGKLHFGLNADRDLVPDLERFGTHLEQAARDLERAVGRLRPSSPRRARGARDASSRRRSRAESGPARAESEPAADRPGD